MHKKYFFQSHGMFLGLMLLSFILFFYRLGTGSLADWDEAIHAKVAKDTLLSHKGYFTLYLNDAPWFHKSPLIYWIMGFLYNFFGISEFTTRVVSAICGVGGIAVTYFLGIRLFSHRVATVSAALLLLTFHYFIFSRRAMLDIPVTFFMLLSLYFFWRGQAHSLNYIFFGVFCGLGFMTKGVVGLLAPAIVFMYLIFSNQLKFILNRYFLLGVVLILIISLPWHIYQYSLYKDIFLHEYFGYHVLKRFAQPIEGHVGGVNYYFSVLNDVGFPVGILGLLSILFLIQKCRKGLKIDHEILFLFVWIVVILGLFTIAGTKISWYIIPLYPALSLASAYFIDAIVIRKYFNPVAVLFVVGVLLTNQMSFKKPFNQDFSPEVKAIAPAVMRHVPEKNKIYAYNIYTAAQFYIDRPIETIHNNYEELERLIVSGDAHFFLVPRKIFDIIQADNDNIVFKKRTILAQNSGIIFFKTMRSH